MVANPIVALSNKLWSCGPRKWAPPGQYMLPYERITALACFTIDTHLCEPKMGVGELSASEDASIRERYEARARSHLQEEQHQ